MSRLKLCLCKHAQYASRRQTPVSTFLPHNVRSRDNHDIISSPTTGPSLGVTAGAGVGIIVSTGATIDNATQNTNKSDYWMGRMNGQFRSRTFSARPVMFCCFNNPTPNKWERSLYKRKRAFKTIVLPTALHFLGGEAPNFA